MIKKAKGFENLFSNLYAFLRKAKSLYTYYTH